MQNKIKSDTFKSRSSLSVKNSVLRQTYRFATSTSLGKRAEQVARIPEWEEVRTRAHAIKMEALEHLDEYLLSLEKQAASHGIQVHWAADSEEAIACVLEVARSIHAKTVVKSKSMTTEEIGLNPALELQGLEVLETDLGEYIVQLAGEPPSHITAPALHKSRHEIGRLFAERLKIPYTDVPEELCAIARKLLREKFLAAQLGISGVNFAAADTGTLVIVENEGNARLSTTLPQAHIAVMGIEKVIPRFSDISTFLKLLAPSATGQRASSYVSFLHSPRKAEELDGPEQLHLIILDNGRSRILADPELRESLCCIRCGACLNICPIYQRAGGHAYGETYPGPIGAVISPLLKDYQQAKELPFASSLCGACSEICPVQVPLHHSLLRLRSELVERQQTPWQERLMMKLFLLGMREPVFYGWGSKMLRQGLKLAGKSGKPLHVPGWSETRDFAPLADQSFKELWRKMAREERKAE